ncbi:hypothetical protein EDB85DRAFT_2209960, partial [Lactarius pseudohatsudake]
FHNAWEFWVYVLVYVVFGLPMGPRCSTSQTMSSPLLGLSICFFGLFELLDRFAGATIGSNVIQAVVDKNGSTGKPSAKRHEFNRLILSLKFCLSITKPVHWARGRMRRGVVIIAVAVTVSIVAGVLIAVGVAGVPAAAGSSWLSWLEISREAALSSGIGVVMSGTWGCRRPARSRDWEPTRLVVCIAEPQAATSSGTTYSCITVTGAHSVVLVLRLDVLWRAPRWSMTRITRR